MKKSQVAYFKHLDGVGRKVGLATLAYLRAFWPSLPVLLATGYVDAKVEAALHADRNLRVIQKPYALAQIRTRILETALSRGEPGQDCPPAS